jgi:hypothetical protein
MGYLSDWQTAKKAFETATGKKKPSEKFVGVFRKSTGLESVTKGLDEAAKTPSLAGMTKAMEAYEKGRIEYLKLLDKADSDEKNADYSKEIATLKKALSAILEEFAKERQKLKDSYKVLTTPLPKSIAKIDLFLSDIAAFKSNPTRDGLMKVATGDGGARGYCTACKFWDQVLAAKMPEITNGIYKGTAMKEFFEFAKEYGANHDESWWTKVLTAKGDEDAAVKVHLGWLEKHVASIKSFQGHLKAVVHELA